FNYYGVNIFVSGKHSYADVGLGAEALKVSDAQRITDYYLASSDEPGRPIRTTRAMGAEGARLRQRASRAVRPLRCADLDAYYLTAA
ncbi:hypothetical protein ABZX04_38520, partial [Streptomyces rochei]